MYASGVCPSGECALRECARGVCTSRVCASGVCATRVCASEVNSVEFLVLFYITFPKDFGEAKENCQKCLHFTVEI